MNHLKSLLTAILPALFIAGVVAASTTISQNIVTDGDLTVGGNVGIGLSVLSEYFHIQDSQEGVQPKGLVEDTDSADWAEWRTVAGTVIGRFTAYGQDHSTRAGQVWINQNTSNPLIFSTGNAERARIDADGDFGIGTNNPGSTLDVAGDVNATGSYLGDGSQLSGLQVSVGENLISYWKFDDSLLDTGLTQDLSLGAGTETYVNSPFGKAIDFDELTYYTANDVDYDFEHTDPFSISFWVYDEGGTSFLRTISKSNNIISSEIGWTSGRGSDVSEQFGFSLLDGTNAYSVTTVSGSVPLNTWTHIVFTYSGNSNQNGLNAYVNGVLSKTGTDLAIGSTILNNLSLTLGAESDGGRKFNGKLDDVKIWNTELTANQAETLFHMR